MTPSEEMEGVLEALNENQDKVVELLKAAKPMATAFVNTIIGSYTDSPEFTKLIDSAYKVNLAKSFIEAGVTDPVQVAHLTKILMAELLG